MLMIINDYQHQLPKQNKRAIFDLNSFNYKHPYEDHHANKPVKIPIKKKEKLFFD